MKHVLLVLLVLLTSCNCLSQKDDVIVKNDPEKDVLIAKIENVASQSSAAIKAVKETLDPNSLNFLILENQERSLIAIKPPTIDMVDMYRKWITKSDFVSAKNEKAVIQKNENDLTALRKKVVELDSLLAVERAKQEAAQKAIELNTKIKYRDELQKVGLYLIIGGILVLAFVSNFTKSGVVLIFGGLSLIASAYWVESPEVKWIVGVTVLLICAELVYFGYKYLSVKKDLPTHEI